MGGREDGDDVVDATAHTHTRTKRNIQCLFMFRRLVFSFLCPLTCRHTHSRSAHSGERERKGACVPMHAAVVHCTRRLGKYGH